MHTMDFASVRCSKRLSSPSRAQDEESILLQIAFAKPTLRALTALAYASLLFFDLAKARSSKECLA
jgi:hypothetical protein